MVRGDDDFAVLEGGAILSYLVEKHGRVTPSGSKERLETLQWLIFKMGGIGPMMGQAMYFQRIAKPNGHENPMAIERYANESRRRLEVLDTRLAGRNWLMGDEMSVADIATYPWTRSFPWAIFPVDRLDNLKAWLDRINARPRTKAALLLPEPRPTAFREGNLDEAASENAARFK